MDKNKIEMDPEGKFYSDLAHRLVYENIFTRGAGLVGLNLIHLLITDHPEWEIFVVDKRIY